MSPQSDAPALILRVTPRGIIPASSIDAETLSGLRFDSTLEARMLKAPPSKALRAWWELMGAVVKADPQWVSGRALSNAILLQCGLYEAELLIGGERREPMSLRSFSELELFRLFEIAKFVISSEIIPGVDIESLLENSRNG